MKLNKDSGVLELVTSRSHTPCMRVQIPSPQPCRWSEYLFCKQNVVGSNPASGLNIKLCSHLIIINIVIRATNGLGTQKSAENLYVKIAAKKMVKRIFIGWYLFILNKNSEISRTRFKICNNCKYITRIFFMRICSECNCVLQAKTRGENKNV